MCHIMSIFLVITVTICCCMMTDDTKGNFLAITDFFSLSTMNQKNTFIILTMLETFIY